MRTRNRGQVLILVALALVALMGFAALAVDVGFLFTVRNQLQRCADSGALAGASAFVGGGSTPATRVTANIQALDYASRDAVGPSPLDSATEVFVSFPLPFTANRIRVNTRRTVNLFFARVFGGNTTTINAFASAEAIVPPPSPPAPRIRLVE